MNPKERFNQILDTCLDRLFQGESINQILADYPDQAKELEPLLRTVVATQAVSKVEPRSDFKSRARYEFMAAARELETQPEHRSFFKWRWQPAWSISLAAIAVIVLAGGGTIAASNYSMPGEALYSVKLAAEQIHLAVTVSEVAKTELNAEFANNRTQEIESLATTGNPEQIQKATAGLNSSLSNMSLLAQVDNKGANTNSVVPPKAPTLNAIAPEPSSQSLMAAPAAAPSSLAPAPAAISGLVASDTPVTTTPDMVVPQITGTDKSASGAGNSNSGESNVTAEPKNNSSNLRNQTNNVSVSNSPKLSEKDKIRKIVEENYQTRKARLEAALDKANPNLRPAIRQAIADSESQYWQSIQNLDQGSNQNSSKD
jgi:hypothetical protein